MANLLTYTHLPLKFPNPVVNSAFPTSRNVVVLASAVTLPEKKTRRRRRQSKEDERGPTSGAEKGLRLVFMQELMERARSRDVAGVSEVIYDMIAAGLSPGPRSFHGLIVSHVLSGDDQGAVRQTSFVLIFFVFFIGQLFCGISPNFCMYVCMFVYVVTLSPCVLSPLDIVLGGLCSLA